MQKALELTNFTLTRVLGDVTGVKGLKILRAILAVQRDPQQRAKLGDRRCQRSVVEIAQTLDGRYQPEHLTELRCCYTLWEKYQHVITELDVVIAAYLHSMRRQTQLPPLAPKRRVRDRRQHGRDIRLSFITRPTL